MAVIKDVAQYAGLSVGVVSKYLNNAGSVKPSTRERIEEAIKALDYVPSTVARTLRTGKSNMLSVVVPDITNPFFAELYNELRIAAKRRGLYLLIQTMDEAEGQGETPDISIPAVNQVDGIIVCFPDDAAFVSRVAEQAGKTPVVLISWAPHERVSANVVLDVRDAVYQTTKHLISLGHRRIAYVGGPSWSGISGAKRQGFEQAVREAGIERECVDQYMRSNQLDTGYNGTKIFLQSAPRPTAIVAENDILAIGCIKSCLEAGVSVPQEMAVTGLDDIVLSSMYEPTVTTAHHPLDAMAETAVEQIVRLRDQQEIGETPVFHTRLIPRKSTG